MRRVRWQLPAAAGVLLALVYVASPHVLVLESAWLVLVAGSSAAVVSGVRLHRPRVARPWYLLAAALGILALANVALLPPWGEQPAMRALSQALELLAFPMFGASSLWLVRAQNPDGDRDGAIDAAIVMVALASVLSTTVFTPEAMAANSVFGWALLVVAPLTLAWVTTATVRLLLGHAGVGSTRLLVSAAGLALIGHVLRGLQHSEAAYVRGDWRDLFIAAAYLAAGLSALQPSMRLLTEPAPEPRQQSARARLVILAAALLTAPTLLLLQGRGAVVPLAASIVVALLTMWRLARLVREREQARDAMRLRSLHDDLTGLPNRAGLLERLAGAAAGRRGVDDGVAVLFVDLDRFKQVNDVHGHAAGDELLVAVAARLAAIRRSGDLLARLSGDEFVLVCERMDERTAALVAQRLVDALGRPFLVRGDAITVTASVGLALSQGTAHDAEQLLAQADAAMYAVKRRGGGAQVRFDARMGDALRRRRRLEADLGPALARHELQLVYQPVVDLVDGEVVGVEALLRWTHATLGPIPPSEVVAVAEHSGAVGPLGEWVLRAACTQLRRWSDDGVVPPQLSLYVNLSARQLLDPRLAVRVVAALADADVDPHRLVLEVTETAVLEDEDDAVGTLQALRRRGVRIALDDFGTGYSSLTHLRRLPVDVVKVDSSFVDDIAGSPTDRAIVEAILHIAAHRGVAVIAEGVERQAQLQALQALGCELAQGYLLGRPAPAEQVPTAVLDPSGRRSRAASPGTPEPSRA